MKTQTLAQIAIAVLFPSLAMATKVVIDRSFGDFGLGIESAKQTDLFTFFHLEETGRDDLGGTHLIIRFQPAGPKFHDLVTLSIETAYGNIQSATLHVSRSFIDGPDEVFARDITSSFLRTALPGFDRIEVSELLLQIKNDYRGGHRVILRADGDQKVPQPLTPEYLTFLGQTVQSNVSLKHMDLHFINTRADGGDQLMIRVDLARPDSRASSCGSNGRK